MIAIGFHLVFLSLISVWIYCLIQILSGHSLEPFQLGTVVTARTALGATYLEVFIGDSLIFLVIIGSRFAKYLRWREEIEVIDKYHRTEGMSFSSILKSRRKAEESRRKANYDDA